ncbi:hypothetical protein FS935_19950 [Metabacillus litoralis]|uniref:Uncharacterized protein n=1 Tax=Metabacillus litoralis TaxID=152268 RepID=A0A5C6VKF8_9BACI|nr:hypothetical protein [Metabacillus litoralis]TXC85777.1 hypothetical protein FS935_19950 [Metabacillus litoralis]
MKSNDKRIRISSTIFILIINSLFICYVVILTAGFLTSNTVAYYSDHKSANGSMTIGIWSNDEVGQQGINNKSPESLYGNTEFFTEEANQKEKSIKTNESIKETELKKERNEKVKIQVENSEKTANEKEGEIK